MKHGRFGPFGGPFMRDWGGEGRQKRGDIKYQILELLVERPRHGYDIIRALEERSGGMYRPSAGSVYPTLQMLEDGGHLTSEVMEGKRVYSITAEGRQLLDQRPPQEEEESGDFITVRDIKESAMKLAAAVFQAARTGDPKLAQKVKQILDRARREVYSLLAEDTSD